LQHDIRTLSDEYQVLKQEYDKKQVIPEILSILSFDMGLLRTEGNYLWRIRRRRRIFGLPLRIHIGIGK
jgi:hypothetical protein